MCKHLIFHCWLDFSSLKLNIAIFFSFASFVMVPESTLVVKVPDSIPLDVACMLPCSGLTTYNAVTTVKPHVELVTKLEGKNYDVTRKVRFSKLGLTLLLRALVTKVKFTENVFMESGVSRLEITQKFCACRGSTSCHRPVTDKVLSANCLDLSGQVIQSLGKIWSSYGPGFKLSSYLTR